MILIVLNKMALVWMMPDWLESWVNYPGLELWKFVNLFLFIAAGLLLHRRFGRPIREGLRSRGEGIKHDLERARIERDQALTKLAEVEARLSSMDEEVKAISEKARLEAQAEKQRIAASTEVEMTKIREQSQREIDAAVKAARHELRAFAAEQSVQLAETILKKEIRPDDDTRLTGMRVQELGRREA